MSSWPSKATGGAEPAGTRAAQGCWTVGSGGAVFRSKVEDVSGMRPWATGLCPVYNKSLRVNESQCGWGQVWGDGADTSWLWAWEGEGRDKAMGTDSPGDSPHLPPALCLLDSSYFGY